MYTKENREVKTVSLADFIYWHGGKFDKYIFLNLFKDIFSL